MRINRNIVECKYKQLLETEILENVLIETLWNVNGVGGLMAYAMNWVLIETLWNVNVKQSIIFNDSETY